MAADSLTDKSVEQLHFLLGCLSCSREALSVDFNEACKKNGMTLARNWYAHRHYKISFWSLNYLGGNFFYTHHLDRTYCSSVFDLCFLVSESI